IATLVARFADEGVRIVIVSGDKDLMQLVTPSVEVWDVMRDVHYTPAAVREKLGVSPDRVGDYLALVGDSSDNVPGVKGVGAKTAQLLLAEGRTLDSLLEHPEHIEEIPGVRGAKKIRERFESDPDAIRLSKRLVTLRSDVEPYRSLKGMEQLAWKTPDRTQVEELFQRLEFGKLLDSIPFLEKREPSKSVVQEEKQFAVVDSQQLADFAAQLAERSEFAFDTETTSLDVQSCELVGISISWKAGEGYFLPLRKFPGSDVVLKLEDVHEHLAPIFANPNCRKIGFNLKYDVSVLERHGFRVAGIAADALIASHLLRPDLRQHGLKVLSERYLHEQMVDFETLLGEAETICDVSFERVSHYACCDAESSWRLAELFDAELGERSVGAAGDEGPSLRRVFEDVEMPLIPVLSRMERAGVRVDTSFLDNLSEQYERELAALEGEIHSLAGDPFNINSPKQLSEVLFIKLVLPTAGVRKTTHGWSTDAAVLQRLCGVHPIADKLLEYRELFKLKTTYVDALSRLVHPLTGRIHSSFNQAVAATGRLSSSDPNLQNIPIRNPRGRKLRDAFIAREGGSLISADYSQIELRVLAHLSEDEALCQAFEQDRDIHEVTATELFGAVAMQGGDRSRLRRFAKTINFGIIYGMGAFRLARELGISRAEAQRYIDDYFRKYRGVSEYFDSIAQRIETLGFVETMFGRRRYLKDVQAAGRDHGYAGRSLANAPIQGTAAEIIKVAMVNLSQLLESFPRNARIILQVHDELVVECESEDVAAVAEAVRDTMESAVPLRVPLRVDVRTGVRWGAET
ncbi:MAG: DNA polymerase I, partial [Bdellovibrionales bacterium]|nr:DNA polymerase I [Bdellovibrionales bacterium]